MNRFAIISGFAAAVLWNAVAAAESPNEQADTVTIPLDQIWAYKMPGTKDIRDLEPEQKSEHLQSLSDQEQRELLTKRLWIPIALSLCADSSPHWPREGQIARPGFAVSGTGYEALRGAYAVLVKGDKPHASFDDGTEITLVFFSYQMQNNVHLHQVRRSHGLIELQYRIEPYSERHLAAHLALIPLGKLHVGNYQVKMTCISLDRRIVELGHKSPETELDRRFVCRPFSFDVVEQKSE